MLNIQQETRSPKSHSLNVIRKGKMTKFVGNFWLNVGELIKFYSFVMFAENHDDQLTNSLKFG